MKSVEERLAELEASTDERLRALEDKVRMLITCTTYDPREPYTAALLQHNIHGDRLTALNLVISALLSRARGSFPRQPEHFPDSGVNLEGIYESRRVSRPEAIALLASAMHVDPSVAERLLTAHKAAGRGASGHAALDS